MTIEFKEEQILKEEKWNMKPYIGYFFPNGELIDYNIMLGEPGHDNWRNPVSLAFLHYISYIIKGSSISGAKKNLPYDFIHEHIVRNEYPGIDEYVKRGYIFGLISNDKDIDCFIRELDRDIENLKGYSLNTYAKFKYDLLLFFRNAYSNKTFFDTIQRKVMVENQFAFEEKYLASHERLNDRRKDMFYRDYLKKTLLSYLKDICVQYLGYDSLERYTPTNKSINLFQSYWDEYYMCWDKKYSFDFLNNPRIISSSYPNINERYYNYLLMGWRVDKLPRYFFNEQTNQYEISEVHECYETEKEEILKKEIESIKKLVPINERYKYFR